MRTQCCFALRLPLQTLFGQRRAGRFDLPARPLDFGLVRRRPLGKLGISCRPGSLLLFERLTMSSQFRLRPGLIRFPGSRNSSNASRRASRSVCRTANCSASAARPTAHSLGPLPTAEILRPRQRHAPEDWLRRLPTPRRGRPDPAAIWHSGLRWPPAVDRKQASAAQIPLAMPPTARPWPCVRFRSRSRSACHA